MIRPPFANSRPINCVVAAGIVLLGTAASASAQASASDSLGSIAGIVVSREGGVPLAYSVVSVGTLGREQFTNDRGAFVLTGMPAGMHRVRVRHLGYLPADIDVRVRAATVDTIRVQLTHIAVRLNAVQVRAYPECKDPGAPKPSRDSAFATVFEQVRQNADQFRLLINEYPFLYGVERITSVTFGRNTVRREGIDTLIHKSADDWRYAPGTVITQDRRRFRRDGPVMMRIPTLAQFADSAFLANHCFHNAGLDVVDGKELLRVDFVAASRIREPDVDGSMYLDPATFQIRRTFLHLSKPPAAIPEIVETEATTIFAELLPSIPVIATIKSVSRLKPDRSKLNPPTATNEDQRLIGVEFTGRKPGEDAKRSPPLLVRQHNRPAHANQRGIARR